MAGSSASVLEDHRGRPRSVADLMGDVVVALRVRSRVNANAFDDAVVARRIESLVSDVGHPVSDCCPSALARVAATSNLQPRPPDVVSDVRPDLLFALPGSMAPRIGRCTCWGAVHIFHLPFRSRARNTTYRIDAVEPSLLSRGNNDASGQLAWRVSGGCRAIIGRNGFALSSSVLRSRDADTAGDCAADKRPRRHFIRSVRNSDPCRVRCWSGLAHVRNASSVHLRDILRT